MSLSIITFLVAVFYTSQASSMRETVRPSLVIQIFANLTNILTPSLHFCRFPQINFDFAWRHGAIENLPPAPMCSKGTFTPPALEKQCSGLHADTGAKSATQCENNCCADDDCIVWQFSNTVSRGVRIKPLCILHKGKFARFHTSLTCSRTWAHFPA